MIIRALGLLTLFIGSICLGLWLQQDPGYILIQSHHWTIETSLWVGAVFILCLAMGLHLILTLIKQIQDIPHQWRIWRSTKMPFHRPKENVKIEYHNIQSLLTHQEDKKAESQLRSALQRTIDDKLLRLYSQVNPTYARIPFIESLLNQTPDISAIYLCLGHLYLKQQLWGQAKTYLNKSIQTDPTPEAYYALGQLFEQLHEAPLAYDMYKQGLSLSLNCGQVRSAVLNASPGPRLG